MKISINPVWLNSFVQLVKTKSFTKTAENLHMTQPGVSQHIKKLELFFSGDLIDRDSTTFSITPLGEEVYQYGTLRKKIESEFVNRLRKSTINTPQIKLSVSSALYPICFSQYLVTYHGENRKKMKITSGCVESVVERMKKGSCDAAFIMTSKEPPVANVTCVGPVKFGVVYKKDMLSSAVLTLEALNQLGMVCYPDMEQEQLLAQFQLDASSISSIPHSCYAETSREALDAVSLTGGFTLVPFFIFNTYHDRHQLQFFQLDETKKLYYMKKSIGSELVDEIKIQNMLTLLIFKEQQRDVLVHKKMHRCHSRQNQEGTLNAYL